MDHKWNLSKIISFKEFNNFNDCESIRQSQIYSTIIEKAGWHLSYFGDKHFIKNKIENFGHQEYNNNNFTNLDIIENRIKTQTDLYGRNSERIEKISIKSNDYLPHNYEKYLLKYVLY